MGAPVSHLRSVLTTAVMTAGATSITSAGVAHNSGAGSSLSEHWYYTSSTRVLYCLHKADAALVLCWYCAVPDWRYTCATLAHTRLALHPYNTCITLVLRCRCNCMGQVLNRYKWALLWCCTGIVLEQQSYNRVAGLLLGRRCSCTTLLRWYCAPVLRWYWIRSTLELWCYAGTVRLLWWYHAGSTMVLRTGTMLGPHSNSCGTLVLGWCGACAVLVLC